MKQKIFIILVLILVLTVFVGCTANDMTVDDADFLTENTDNKTEGSVLDSESAQEKIPFQLVDLSNISAEYYEENGKCYIKINGIGDINNIDFYYLIGHEKYDPKNNIVFDWEERHSMIEQVKKGELSKEHLKLWLKRYKTDVIELPDVNAFEKLSYIEQNKFMSAILTKFCIQMEYSYEGQPFESCDVARDYFIYSIYGREQFELSEQSYRRDYVEEHKSSSESIKIHGLDAVKYQRIEDRYYIEYRLNSGNTKICVFEYYKHDSNEEKFSEYPVNVVAFFINEEEDLYYTISVSMPTVTPEPEWFLQFVES